MEGLKLIAVIGIIGNKVKRYYTDDVGDAYTAAENMKKDGYSVILRGRIEM